MCSSVIPGYRTAAGARPRPYVDGEASVLHSASVQRGSYAIARLQPYHITSALDAAASVSGTYCNDKGCYDGSDGYWVLRACPAHYAMVTEANACAAAAASYGLAYDSITAADMPVQCNIRVDNVSAQCANAYRDTYGQLRTSSDFLHGSLHRDCRCLGP